IPADVYWGIHTLRAVENFPISGRAIGLWPELVRALALVKHAAAQTNYELGLLDQAKAKLIIAACREIASGALHDQFVVDQIQGGAGTSTNMNANEVIANRALELGGRQKGDYAFVHPIEHVNVAQSTNDVYPTALRLAARFAIVDLIAAMEELKQAFAAKSEEFRDILKVGRTQLQDAVPMTLGQEFSTFAVMLGEDQQRLHEAGALIEEINLGATAIGTGINSHPGYAPLACKHLVALSGVQVKTAENLVEATQDCGAFVQLSGVLKRIAVKLSKTCNDLRLLSSGPRAGLGEINLPAVQAGSSIMPGKINPSIPEMVNQVCFQALGFDTTVAMASEAGQLELNVMMPVITHNMVFTLMILGNASRVFAERCIDGIEADEAQCAYWLERSPALVTALAPKIGYAESAKLAKEAVQRGLTVKELVVEKGLLEGRELEEVLDLRAMTEIGVPGGKPIPAGG
ncbi:MAG TPA: aspartate ammonia-lyase, partial [Dokdonella sp.]